MTVSTQGDKNLSLNNGRGNVSQAMEQFVNTTIDALESAEAEDELVQEVRNTGDTLVEEVEKLESDVVEAEEQGREAGNRVDELEDELSDTRNELAREQAQDRKRIHNIEQELEEIKEVEGGETSCSDAEPGSSTGENTVQKTPLEQIVELDEETAVRELTANQERARFIAKDATDYARKVPAGYAITSKEISTVIAAKENGKPHQQTVSRIMKFLTQFGKDHVKTVKRHGTKRIILTEQIVKQLSQIDQNNGNQGITPVVTKAG